MTAIFAKREFVNWSSIDIGTVNQINVRSRHMRAMQTNWHEHEDSDEMFIVLEGEMSIEIIQKGEQKTTHLQKGHSLVVPKHTRHRVCVKEFANLIVIDGISPL